VLNSKKSADKGGKFARLAEAKLGGFLADTNLVRLALIMVGAFTLMAVLNPSMYLNQRNFQSMAFQFPEIGLMSIAVMIAMLMGGINLSVLGIANLSAIIAAHVMIAIEPTLGGWAATFIGIATALAIGVVCGALNGSLIAWVGIPAILATLGTMEIFTGLAIYITGGSAVFGLPEQFAFIGSGNLGPIPMPLIIFIAIVAIYLIVLQRKKFGLEVYLMGTNRKAARFTGILTERTIVKAHMLSGLLAAMGGVIMASRAVSAKADYGSSYTIMAILVAVLGGTSPFGGFGKVMGVVMAIMTIQFLSSGFNILRADAYFRTFIWGALLVVMLLINYYGNKISDKKQIKAMHAAQKEIPENKEEVEEV